MVCNVCLFQFYCLLMVVKKKQMWIIILESKWIGMYDVNLSFSINKGDLNSEKGYWLFSALHAKCFDVYQKEVMYLRLTIFWKLDISIDLKWFLFRIDLWFNTNSNKKM